MYAAKPTPATPSAGSLVEDDDDDDDDDNGRAEVYDEDDDADRNPAGSKAAAALDPYANLDSAFAGHADSGLTKASGRKDDDLLI